MFHKRETICFDGDQLFTGVGIIIFLICAVCAEVLDHIRPTGQPVKDEPKRRLDL